MYNLVNNQDLKNNFPEDTEQINEFDYGNDFENIINQSSNEIIQY